MWERLIPRTGFDGFHARRTVRLAYLAEQEAKAASINNLRVGYTRIGITHSTTTR